MADTFITDLIARVRYHGVDATTWPDANVTDFIGKAVGRLSLRVPYNTVYETSFLGGTRMIDISSLTDYHRILLVRYKLGDSGDRNVPREYKNFRKIGDKLEVELGATPSPSTNVTGTATAGTTTNTLEDSDEGQFAATMVNAEVRNTTDGTKTYITAYTDVNTVTIKDDIFVSGEAYTIYETTPVEVEYQTKHTYTETSRTFPSSLEDILIDAIKAEAMSAQAVVGTNHAVFGKDVSMEYLRHATELMRGFNRDLDLLSEIVVEQLYPEG